MISMFLAAVYTWGWSCTGYCVSLPDESHEKLRMKLSDDLPRRDDGTIALYARAWAIKTLPRSGLQ